MGILQMLRNKQGQAKVATVIGALAVTIIIVLLIFFEVSDAVDRTGFNTATNATFDTIQTTVLGGLGLLAVLIFVIVGKVMLDTLS